jgi:hypothetical protein
VLVVSRGRVHEIDDNEIHNATDVYGRVWNEDAGEGAAVAAAVNLAGLRITAAIEDQTAVIRQLMGIVASISSK